MNDTIDFIKEKNMGETSVSKVKQIYFEDVELGGEIPGHTKKYTLIKMALFASVNGNWCPGHYDYKWAKEKFNQPAPFAYGFHITSHCGQLITNWIGANGVLKKFTSRTINLTFPDDVITYRGKVTGKYVQEEENYLECEFLAEKQDGTLVARGLATVTLPSLNR